MLFYRSIIFTVIGIMILVLSKISILKNTPRFKHYLGLTFLLMLLIPISFSNKFNIYNFISTTKIENFQYDETRNSMFSFSEKNSNFIKIYSGSTYNIFNYKEFISWLIIIGWIAIASIKIISIFIKYIILNFSSKNYIIKDSEIVEILDKCKAKLKIRRKINLVKNNVIENPSVFGIINIKIFISDDFLNLSNDELYNIFMHELSHCRRMDNLVNIIILFLKAIYFFNPFIIKLMNIVKQNMEYATDELATKEMNKDERKRYCSVIVLATAISKNYSKTDLALGLSVGRQKLTERINLIFEREDSKINNKKLMIFNIIAIIVIYTFFGPTSYLNKFRKILTVITSDNQVIKLESNFENAKTIVILEKGYLELDIKSNEYITYQEKNSSSKNFYLQGDKIEIFSHGEYIYKFVTNNNESEYYLKVIVK